MSEMKLLVKNSEDLVWFHLCRKVIAMVAFETPGVAMVLIWMAVAMDVIED